MAFVSNEPHRRPYRLYIAATHPIQYQVPWFQALARIPEIRLKVYYGTIPTPSQQGEGFGRAFSWDIPLLDGYEWETLHAARPGAPLGGFWAQHSRRVWKSLRREPPDMLIVTGWHSLLLLQFLAAAMVLRIPRAVRGDSHALKPRNAIVRLLHRMLLQRFDTFLTVGRANRRFYLSYGIEADRLFETPHFVDNARFVAQAEALRDSREAIRRGWGIRTDATCFLFAGKFEPIKRLPDFLRAVAAAFSAGASVHGLIVGSGAQERDARAIAGSSGAPVTFAGFLNQTEISRAYVAADCLILPSDYETWGLVVNEAMASGLPAVVSDRVGCGPDLVVENETGAIFPFGEVEKLAGLIARMASERNRLREMGRKARERVLREYSVEKTVAGTMAALQAVAGRR